MRIGKFSWKENQLVAWSYLEYFFERAGADLGCYKNFRTMEWNKLAQEFPGRDGHQVRYALQCIFESPKESVERNILVSHLPTQEYDYLKNFFGVRSNHVVPPKKKKRSTIQEYRELAALSRLFVRLEYENEMKSQEIRRSLRRKKWIITSESDDEVEFSRQEPKRIQERIDLNEKEEEEDVADYLLPVEFSSDEEACSIGPIQDNNITIPPPPGPEKYINQPILSRWKEKRKPKETQTNSEEVRVRTGKKRNLVRSVYNLHGDECFTVFYEKPLKKRKLE